MIELPPPLWLPPRPAIIRPADRELLKLARRDAIEASRREASFMPGMFPAGAVSSRPLPAISFVGITKGNAPNPNTSISFPNVPIGAEDPTRRVVFVVHTLTGGGGFRSVTAFTVDGVSVLPAIFTQNGASGNSGQTAFFSILKPTGLTANLALTFNSASGGTNISVETFRAVNENFPTPNNFQGGAASANAVNMVIDVPANGWVLAAAVMFGSPTPTSINLAGVTKTSDDVVGTSAVRCATGVQNVLPAQTGRPISAASVPPTTAAQTAGIAGISWG